MKDGDKQPNFKSFLLEAFDEDLARLGDPREYLVSVTASCLINEMRYYESDDRRREVLLGALQLVEGVDPEFVLQLAVYLRRELGIRTTTNFVLAYAACSESIRGLLPDYFTKATVLPTDLIEVCEFTQLIHLLRQGLTTAQVREDNELDKFEVRRHVFLPNALKKVLVPKILEFTEYQLAKYCSEASRKATLDKYMSSRKGTPSKKSLKAKARQLKKAKLEKEDEKEAAKEEPEKTKEELKSLKKCEKLKKLKRRKMIAKHSRAKKSLLPADVKKKAIEHTFLTMKDLIGQLHIKPTRLTSAVIGTKYPKTQEEYELKFGGGGFDEQLAGKRMKLRAPNTWETMISSNGNKPEVWEELIARSELPYLATLRNLRNIVLSGVRRELIEKVADFLADPEHVRRARTTPLQYYSAISELNKAVAVPKDEIEDDPEFRHRPKSKPRPKPAVATPDKPLRIEEVALLSEALSIALQRSIENVEEIKGATQIFVDVSGSMQCPMSGGKSFGSVRECYELAIILGLLVKAKCQHCQYYIFSSSNGGKCYLLMDTKLTGNLAHDIQVVKQDATTLGGGTDFPTEVVEKAFETRAHIDNIIILSDMMISRSESGVCEGETNGYIEAISKYRDVVNPALRVFSVDLAGYSKAKDTRKEFREKNFVRIFGANESILKFIATKEGAQVEFIRDYHKSLP